MLLPPLVLPATSDGVFFPPASAACSALPHDNDTLLLIRIMQRDEGALGQLYSLYARRVYTLALHITQQSQIAEEVVQDVFQSVWQSAGGFHFGSSVRTWILGITRHRAIDTTRVRGHRTAAHSISLETWNVEQYDPWEGVAEGVFVRTALATLSAAQQQVLTLAYYHGLSNVQIAAHLNLPLGTIKTRLRSALGNLRTLLNKESVA